MTGVQTCALPISNFEKKIDNLSYKVYNSDEYQRLNFIHGMGTGSALHSVANIAGRNITAVSNVGEFLSKTFINANRTWSNFSVLFSI